MFDDMREDGDEEPEDTYWSIVGSSALVRASLVDSRSTSGCRGPMEFA